MPRRGSVVRKIPLGQVEELYAVRGLLEGYGARKAVESGTDAEIRELKKILDECERVCESGDHYRAIDLNNHFHQKLLAFSGPIVNKVIEDLRIHTIRMQYMATSMSYRAEQALKEHRVLVEAIEKRDADEADRITQKHMQNGFKAAKRFIKSQETQKKQRAG